MLYVLANTLKEFYQVLDICNITVSEQGIVTGVDVSYVPFSTANGVLCGVDKPVVLTLSCNTVGSSTREFLLSRRTTLIPVYCPRCDQQMIHTIQSMRDRCNSVGCAGAPKGIS